MANPHQGEHPDPPSLPLAVLPTRAVVVVRAVDTGTVLVMAMEPAPDMEATEDMVPETDTGQAVLEMARVAEIVPVAAMATLILAMMVEMGKSMAITRGDGTVDGRVL